MSFLHEACQGRNEWIMIFSLSFRDLMRHKTNVKDSIHVFLPLVTIAHSLRFSDESAAGKSLNSLFNVFQKIN